MRYTEDCLGHNANFAHLTLILPPIPLDFISVIPTLNIHDFDPLSHFSLCLCPLGFMNDCMAFVTELLALV